MSKWIHATGLCAVAIGGAFAWQKAAISLPEPYATPSTSNGAKVVPQPDGAQLKTPAGFTVAKYATGFERPRFMALGPSGEVLLSDMTPTGTVYVLADSKHDFHPAEKKVLLDHLDRPYGLAFWKDYLYVAETTSLKRYKYDAKAMTVGASEEIVPMKDFGKGHVTRTIAFGKDGKLYLAAGSSANVVTGDPAMRAAITRYNPDGTGQEIVASGLRNPVGMRFQPQSGKIWASVQERDGLGDGLVPDYFTEIRTGGFYGWPYSYIGSPWIRGLRRNV